MLRFADSAMQKYSVRNAEFCIGKYYAHVVVISLFVNLELFQALGRPSDQAVIRQAAPLGAR